jgi:hypothetical protein
MNLDWRKEGNGQVYWTRRHYKDTCRRRELVNLLAVHWKTML